MTTMLRGAAMGRSERSDRAVFWIALVGVTLSLALLNYWGLNYCGLALIG